MSRDFIEQLYLHTPLWLWPVLWVEIYWMQNRLARLPDAHDPKDLYEVRLNNWGQLQLIKLYTHVDASDLDAWKSGSRLDSDLFASEFFMSACPLLIRSSQQKLGSQASSLIGQVHAPLSAHPSLRSRPAPGTRNLGTESLYLDPG